MNTFRKTLASVAVAGALAVMAAPANAVVTLDLADNWKLDVNNTGDHTNAVIVEKLLLAGYSHVNNDFGTDTFIESGILQVTGYIDPITGGSNTFNTDKDMYISWEGVNGTQAFTGGGNVNIDFNNASASQGTFKFFLDDTPEGSLKINDTDFGGGLFTNDADSFLDLANGLTQIAEMAVINSALNTDTNLIENTGGSFDLAVGAGVGEFVVWTATDVAAGYFYALDGTDLEDIDYTIAGGEITEEGTLASRTSVDAQQSPFTFDDATSTEGPGLVDDTIDASAQDEDGLADASQEDNFEAALQAIHGLAATPDYMQKYDGDLMEDFFVFHVGDHDLQTIPEPGSLALMGMGLLGLGGMAARRRTRKA